MNGAKHLLIGPRRSLRRGTAFRAEWDHRIKTKGPFRDGNKGLARPPRERRLGGARPGETEARLPDRQKKIRAATDFSKDPSKHRRHMVNKTPMDDRAPTDDEDLAARAGRGCEESFRHLFERYYPLIHSYAWKLCGDSAAADDIAQQTFIKAASTLRSRRRVSRFKSWIHRVALNTARDECLQHQ